MSTAAAYIAIEDRFGARCYRSTPIVLSRGEGVYLWDVQGKRYIDGMSAYSAVNLGHAHPRIVEALTNQANTLSMISRAYHSDQLALALEAVSRFFGYERSLFINSGAEAVETSIKLARRWGYVKKHIPHDQAEIIVMANNFHGRTLGATSCSTHALYRENFGPLLPGFRPVPFGDIDALKQAITPHTCAILLEPIQGEAGIIMPPYGWLKAVRALCDDQNILMLADEVQSGIGRSGHRLFCQSEGVKPDVVMLGKSLGGGVLPVSAVLADSHVMDVLTLGSHGSTFGGNPLASRMVREVLSIVEEDQLCQKSLNLGASWLEALRSANLRGVVDVRGSGLWIAIEIDSSLPQFADWTRQKVQELAEHGLLTKETRGHILRLAPPLIISPQQLDEVLSILKKVFT